MRLHILKPLYLRDAHQIFILLSLLFNFSNETETKEVK